MRVITFRAIIMAMSAAILAYMTIRTFVLAGASAHDDSRVHPLAEKSMREFLEVTNIDEALNKLNYVVPNFEPKDRLSMLSVSRQGSNVYCISALLDKRLFLGRYSEGLLTPAVNNVEAVDKKDTLFIEEWAKWMLEQLDAPYVCFDFKSVPEFYRVLMYNNQTCTAGFLFLTEKTSRQYRDLFESLNRLGHTPRGDVIIKVTNNVFIITERR